MKKESSGFENFLKKIMSSVLFVLPISNIAINNWCSNWKQCLFFINIIPLCIIALVLLIKTFNHKDEEPLDFWLNNDLEGFIYKFFTTLLTLSSIVYNVHKDNVHKGISNVEKTKDTVDLFLLKCDVENFEIGNLIIMTVIIAGSLWFYSHLKKSKKEPKVQSEPAATKEPNQLIIIFAINLLVFIEFLAALFYSHLKKSKKEPNQLNIIFAIDLLVFNLAELFYSHLKKSKKEPNQLKKETNQLNIIFAIDLFVFIEYLTALLVIKEIKSFDSDVWNQFYVASPIVFLIVFLIFFKFKGQPESTAPEEPKVQSN